MADYITFTLDGFHNRLVPEWGSDPAYGAKIVETPPHTAPGYFTGRGRMQWVAPRHYGPGRVTTIVSWRLACRKHARIHGAAGAWHADDSLTLFYREGDKIRTKTFSHARPAA